MKKVEFGKRYKLAGVLYKPNKIKKAAVLSHGFQMDKNGPFDLFERLSERLVKRGYLVLRFDYGGCGESGDELAKFSLCKRILDLKDAVDYAKSICKGEVYLVGHSLGGLLSLIVGSELKIKKVVLWAPPLKLRVPHGRFRKMFRKKYRIRGIKMMILLLRFLFSFVGVEMKRYLKKFNGKILMFCDLNDACVNYNNIEETIKYGKDLTVVRLDGAGHYFRNRQEELLKATEEFLEDEKNE